MAISINENERTRRQQLVISARSLISQALPVEDSDESSLSLGYNEFYLQIAFSELHPLMVLYLARMLSRQCISKDIHRINDLNLNNILGSHALNFEVGCYSFRAVHWLDTEISKDRFLEMLERDVEEAGRAYELLINRTGENS